jgi:Uma2 family endonuclease
MATTRLFTIADLEQSPPEGEWELIDGELAPVHATSLKATTTALRIARIVGNHVDAHDLGMMTGADGGFVLFPDRETLLVPNVAFIRKDRVPPEEEHDRFPRLAPDMVVEVLSPTGRMASALGKISLYMEAGVEVVWLVDPVKRTVSALVEDDAPVRLSEHDDLTGGRVLPGFSIRISDLLG